MISECVCVFERERERVEREGGGIPLSCLESAPYGNLLLTSIFCVHTDQC